jgi:hypothetical protein
MLWLMLLLLWSIRVFLGGPSAAAPATRVLLYLLALLGVLQVIVTSIDILEFTIAILLG